MIRLYAMTARLLVLALMAATFVTGAQAQYHNGAAPGYSPPVYQAPVSQAPVWSPPVIGNPAPYMAPPGTPAGTYYVPPVTGKVNPYVPSR
jgi:hypothetical protein